MKKVILLLVFFMIASPLFASELTVVCLGDSITGPRPNTEYLDHYSKYADLLQLILETRLGAGKAKVVNRGYAGNTSTQALARVDEEVVPLKPDIVVILIGGNDYGSKADPQGIAAVLRQNLMSMIDKVKKAGGKVLLLQYADPKADNMEKVWTHLNAGNPVIAEVAKQENVPTLELAPAFREAAKTHPLADLASPTDGVHLNPYGEIVVARTIFFKLQDLGWIPKG
jgi:lysophospholipase L1-like esterase